MFLLICKTCMHWLGLELATSSSISSLWEEDPFKIELTSIIPRGIFVSTYPFLFGKDSNSKSGLINRQLFLYLDASKQLWGTFQWLIRKSIRNNQYSSIDSLIHWMGNLEISIKTICNKTKLPNSFPLHHIKD